MSSPMEWKFDTPPNQKRPFEAYSVGEHVETRAGEEYGKFGLHSPDHVYDRSASHVSGPAYSNAGFHRLDQGYDRPISHVSPQVSRDFGSSHPVQEYSNTASPLATSKYGDLCSSPPVPKYSNTASPVPMPKCGAASDYPPAQVFENFGMRQPGTYWRDMMAACTSAPAPAQDHDMSGIPPATPAPVQAPSRTFRVPDSSSSPDQQHYMSGALPAPVQTPSRTFRVPDSSSSPDQQHYMSGALPAPVQTPSRTFRVPDSSSSPDQQHYMSGALPAPVQTPSRTFRVPDSSSSPDQQHYMSGALPALTLTPAPRQDHYSSNTFRVPSPTSSTPSPDQQHYIPSVLPAPNENPVSLQGHYMAGALPTPAPVRDYYVSGAFPNPDNDSVSAPDYHIPGELPAAIQEPELVHTEHGPTLLEQVHMFEVPAQPSVVNRVAGIIYNVTLWTGICLVQGLLYPPRLVYSNRGRVRQAASDTYRVAMQAVGGIKRRAVELHRPRRAPTPHEELREIVRASHRPLRSSTLRPSRISPPKMTTLANEQLRLETLRHVQINELMRYNEEDLEYIPLPSTSTKSVKFVESPRTGRPVTRVKKFVVGEAMDFYMSSSPCVSSTYPEGSVERMEAEASESPLEYHLAKMEGCSHEDALKQIPNGAIPDRRTKYIISASGSPAERKAWNNKDKENTASPSNETFEAFATLTDAKTQNGKSEETIPSPMALPSGVSRTPDSAAAIDGKTQKEPKATSPTAEANMVTTTIATPTIPTTPMARSLSAKAAMDSMEQDMGVFSISSRTYKVRDTVRKQKAEEARLAKARRKAEERAKKEAEAEEERKKKSERRMPTEKVIKPLSAEWEKKVDAALAAGDGAQLATTSTGNTLKRKDFGTVLPVAGRDRAGGWLNDEIITGYLQAVVDHGQAMTNSTGRGKTPKYYAFNTFFYSNIRDKGVESVKRWATKGRIGGKALLDVERVFIPVHEHSHWTNIVVGPMARTIEYFDSMGGSPRRYIANVKAWLEQELGPAYVEEEWAVVNSSSPQQQNGLDCGVFAATTAKMIMLGINPMAYGHEDIPTQRRRMVAELLNGGFHGVFEP